MSTDRYPVYRARFNRVDCVATRGDAIFAQRAEEFVRHAREVARYKEWQRTPLLARIRHAVNATLPDVKDRR